MGRGGRARRTGLGRGSPDLTDLCSAGQSGVKDELPGESVEGVAVAIEVHAVGVGAVGDGRDEGQGPGVDEGHPTRRPRGGGGGVVPADAGVVPPVLSGGGGRACKRRVCRCVKDAWPAGGGGAPAEECGAAGEDRIEGVYEGIEVEGRAEAVQARVEGDGGRAEAGIGVGAVELVKKGWEVGSGLVPLPGDADGDVAAGGGASAAGEEVGGDGAGERGGFGGGVHADCAAVGLVAAAGMMGNCAADIMVLMVGGEVEGDVYGGAADGEEGYGLEEDATYQRVPDERYPQTVGVGCVEDVADMLC